MVKTTLTSDVAVLRCKVIFSYHLLTMTFGGDAESSHDTSLHPGCHGNERIHGVYTNKSSMISYFTINKTY